MNRVIPIILLLLLSIGKAQQLCLSLEKFEKYFFQEGSCFDVILKKGKGVLSGSGSFGSVYKCDVLLASRTKLNVAMKKMAIQTKDDVDQILNEIETMERLSDMKNVFLPLYYGCIYDHQHHYVYMFMENLNDEFVYKRSEKRNEFMTTFYKFPLKDQLEVILGISRAIQSMHDQNLGHFDIKPENIMSKDSKIVKPIDFGLAYEIKDSSDISKKSNEWFLRGTPELIDPLMYAHGYTPDLRSDVYSLGITFIESWLKLNIHLNPKNQNIYAAINHRDQKVTNSLIKIRNYYRKNRNEPNAQAKIHICYILLRMISHNKEERPSMRKVVLSLETILKHLDKNSEYLNESEFRYKYFKMYKNEFQPTVFVPKRSLPEEEYIDFKESIRNNGTINFINEIERYKAKIKKKQKFLEYSSTDSTEIDESYVSKKNDAIKKLEKKADKQEKPKFLPEKDYRWPLSWIIDYLSNICGARDKQKLLI